MPAKANDSPNCRAESVIRLWASVKIVCGCPNLSSPIQIPSKTINPTIENNSKIIHNIYQLEKPSIRNDNNILLYPNPTSGVLNLSFSNIEGRKDVQIIDIYGRVKIQHSFDSYDTKIDLSNLNPGIYFVIAITADENFIMEKIIKE